MHTISRRIAAFALAGALILPTTAGVAHAQSSFGSSSTGNEYTNTPGGNTGNTGNTGNSNNKAERIKRAYENHLKNLGHPIEPTAESHSEALVTRALNNELKFYDNVHYQPIVADQDFLSFVIRATPKQVDAAIAKLDSDPNAEETLSISVGPSLKPVGVAIGHNSEYYYLAFSVLND